MKHEDYKYVNVTINGPFNRKNVIDINRLGTPEGIVDAYMTYFRYNDEMVEHFKKVESVKGYDGSAWSDWLPIDIDSENLEEAQREAVGVIHKLQEYDIDENTCRFFFSGAKGFHILIPSGCFEAIPSKDIHKRFKRVALKLTEGIKIDSSIYDKTRIFRLPNSKHSKSGLHKVELTPMEVMNLTINEIQHKALLPVEELEVDDEYDPSLELTKLYYQDFDTVKNTAAKEGAKAKICLETMMHQTDLEGERDNVGIRIASHLRQSGLNPKMIWSSLDTWNMGLKASLETYEVERIYEQGQEEYQFGCHDEFLKSRCDPNCVFFNKDWQDAQERIKNYEKRNNKEDDF